MYEDDRGYASKAEEPNAFGLANSATLVTLEPSPPGTLLTWAQHYDPGDLAMHKDAFAQALPNIAQRLIARFGGRVVERYVEGG